MSEIVNIEQAAAWDGPSGQAWVEREERQNETLRPHTDALFARAAVGPADRVLDVGCGCGETTRMCARLAADGNVLGIDLSAAMLERARLRAAEEGITNAEFVQADAQVHAFGRESFDLVTSRFGVMFFADPIAAFTNLARGVRPAGRLAVIVWQDLADSEWMRETRGAVAVALGITLPDPPVGAPGPFGLADRGHSRSVLTASGWDAVEFEAVDAPFRFGENVEDSVAFIRDIGMVRALFEGLDPDATARALDALRATAATHLTGDGVIFGSRCWIITARRS